MGPATENADEEDIYPEQNQIGADYSLYPTRDINYGFGDSLVLDFYEPYEPYSYDQMGYGWQAYESYAPFQASTQASP